MQSKVLHGRREGQVKDRGLEDWQQQQSIGLTAQGIDPRSVLVVQPKDWKRIQDNLTRYDREAELAKQKAAERENLHETSKNLVKHWENTNEGIRLKKLQARKLREEKEEEERKKIDIEEARLQAEKRREAIERAKTLQYYQTDRVKEFHGALLLTEVLKERDAQIDLKKKKKNWEAEQDEHLHRLKQRQIEEQIKIEHEKAQKRFQSKRATAEFQLLQVQDHIDESLKIKDEDVVEGKNIKEQVEIYEAAKAAIQKQKRADKVKLMETYKTDMQLKQEHKKEEKIREKEEDKEINRFVNAKKKMIKMRQATEAELFQKFQDYTEEMRQKLHEQITQKVDDEDTRIAKAVEEREKKRLMEEQMKEENKLKTLEAIGGHRMATLKQAEREKIEQIKKDKEILKSRVKEDTTYHRSMEEKKRKEKGKAITVKNFLLEQMDTKNVKATAELQDKLEYDKKNLQLIVKEEEQFQEYAQKVIGEAKANDRNTFPLVKAASAGPGGGRGPKFVGNGGLRPSYPVADATGVQLPFYRKDGETHSKAYGHVGRSGKRIGFTW
eukprot:gene3148-3617_t